MFQTYFTKNFLIRKYHNLINKINNFEESFKTFSDNEIRIAGTNLRKKYLKTNCLEDFIAPSFALTREASKRTIGLRHYDVQILGGLVLNSNKIAEMKTGEGKTLVATLPACLNGISQKGVHIITVNDYLASRDQASMFPIYNLLGLKTGLIQENMGIEQRKINYKSDLTYVTNTELAFDFLRDNITRDSSNIVLRSLHYGIIDEVDSVLIDEAQTPVILTNIEKDISVDKYITASEVINYLKLNKHYLINEKDRNIILTSAGSKQVELILKTKDLYDRKNPWVPYIINALKAKYLFFNNTDYIVQNGRISIIDQSTGRIMTDRRWGEGLQQAIEAKEKLSILPETETQATITYQHFFLMYPKLSGMTGTAKTSQVEFEKIYKLPVNVIPTFARMIRQDLPDLIYRDQFSKWNAIAQFCKKLSEKGQPILVGTTTIEKSEMLAQLLNEYNLSYQILNAKPENIRRESEIVAQAGVLRTITIATNMAGRGTDIILGGNITIKIQAELYGILTASKFYRLLNKKSYIPYKFINKCQLNSQRFFNALKILLKDSTFLQLSDSEILQIIQVNITIREPRFLYEKIIKILLNDLKESYKKLQSQQSQIIKNLGGLYVIGTERNDSRRIDNQLRGRCGRQGDPGTSRFFLSLEDNLFRLFGSNTNKIQTLLNNEMRNDKPINSKIISKALDSAQQAVEERAFEQRKNIFDYGKSLDKQRQVVYSERNFILKGKYTHQKNFSYGEQFICDFIQNKINLRHFIECFENLFGRTFLLQYFNQTSLFDEDELKIYLYNEFWLAYQTKIEEVELYGKNGFNKIKFDSFLFAIDLTWKEHLQKTILLRDVIGWRAYGQQNPLTEYNREILELFAKRKEECIYYTIYSLFRLTIV